VSRASRKAKYEAVRDYALGLPGAWEDHPWGDTVVKVGRKIFVFLGDGSDRGGYSVKLRESQEQALAAPGSSPTSYGLGKAGWVSIPFTGRSPAVGLLCDWVEESYRLIAPKKLIKQLDEGTSPQ
jgi:predicted DNA-binding protein (MmcQ/YjbR family)